MFMSDRRIVPFKISSMDSLGQGVSKESDKITFIAKSATGDEGEAEVIEEKKGVAFARIKKLTAPSHLRRPPECPHFDLCPSCHYLHVSYEQELQFKRETLEKLFHKIQVPTPEVVAAPTRIGYRNRVQLHYDLSQKKLGMFNAKTNEILPIPHCLIGLPSLGREIQRLYEGEQWLKEIPPGPKKGHVELYWRNGELKVSWNRPYAEGGFTQVYEEMNQKLKQTLASWSTFQAQPKLLDLFGGNGNLSNGLNYSKRLCVDKYSKIPDGDFFSQDLYSPLALRNVERELRKRDLRPQVLLLDPPRSGLKDLKVWVDLLAPKFVAYISCDPHTLVRDIASLNGMKITNSFLFDFFPSTFHFETMLFLERKS